MNGLNKKENIFLFPLILAACYFILVIGLWGIWRISFLGLESIHPALPYIFGGTLLALCSAFFFCLLGMVLGLLGMRLSVYLQKKIQLMVNTMFYPCLLVGKSLGISKRRLEGAYVQYSNRMFQNNNLKVKPERLLVVTPHCLQWSACPHKITRDPQNCKRCGKCDVGALVAMAQEYGFHFFVVTGGTLARQTVKKIRPQAVLAIACERDLASGIQDVYPIPSFGVVNLRPNGPCYDTRVDLEEFKIALEGLLEEKEEKEAKENG